MAKLKSFPFVIESGRKLTICVNFEEKTVYRNLAWRHILILRFHFINGTLLYTQAIISRRLVGLFMVLNATFNNISVISWWSVLLVEETVENHRQIANH
jgi:hypothetical protein